VSRYIDEPIIIHINKESRPTAFIWRKRLYRVAEILAWWREPGEWWNGEPIRLFVRVSSGAQGTGTYEIYKKNSEWFIYSVLD
jgi:hypothetical protein